jgi:mono/diheme cytochrome c family protein
LSSAIVGCASGQLAWVRPAYVFLLELLLACRLVSDHHALTQAQVQGGFLMKALFAALLMLPLGQAAGQAQDAQAGKALWDGLDSQCRNCHGANGEGAFGPDLAGRGLTVAQYTQAIRKPWGIMPAYISSQISDAEIAGLAAHFNALSAVAEPGKWRFAVPGNARRGQAVALSLGCGQCHGPQLNGPRANMGAVDMDFDWFKSLVYNHTTAYPQHAQRLEESPRRRMRMGNFNPMRVSESQLREIYDWAREIGVRARVVTRLGKGTPGANGVTYTLTVENGGLPGKAPTVDDPVVHLIIPADTEVVATTGPGYQGVKMDEKAKANVATWQAPAMAPKAKQTFTITLSKAATAASNLRGDVRWTKPAVKTGPSDAQAIAPAPL